MNWNLKDIVVMLTGLGLCLLGVKFGMLAYTRILGVGLVFAGLGTIALGATGGFLDTSPITSRVSKLGIVAYVIGIPALVYGLWQFH